MTSHPKLVSRAIFEWWWVERNNRSRFLRGHPDEEVAVGAVEDSSAERGQLSLAGLSMDGVGFDLPGLVLSFLNPFQVALPVHKVVG
jgi:hypothetical protein